MREDDCAFGMKFPFPALAKLGAGGEIPAIARSA